MLTQPQKQSITAAALRTLYFWIMFPAFTAFLFNFVIAQYIRHRFRGRTQKLSFAIHDIAGFWGRGVLSMTPGWSFDLQGQENLPNEHQSFVLVANHLSAVDILALFMIRRQFRWLSKAEVFKLPIIGQAMKLAGYVPIKRGDKTSHLEAMRQSSDWLDQEVSMIFFPEGSRSATGELKPFRIGAFRLAKSNGCPVLPVVLDGTQFMMRKRSIIPKPAKVIIRILPLVDPHSYDSAEALQESIRNQIANSLQDIRS